MNKTELDAMVENLNKIDELINIIDFDTLDNDTLHLLCCITEHQSRLMSVIVDQDSEIKELQKKIDKMHKDHFEFTHKCCQNY